MTNFQQQAAALKKDLRTAMEPVLRAFIRETGVTPSRITVNSIDITTVGSVTREAALGEVEVEFKL